MATGTATIASIAETIHAPAFGFERSRRIDYYLSPQPRYDSTIRTRFSRLHESESRWLSRLCHGIQNDRGRAAQELYASWVDPSSDSNRSASAWRRRSSPATTAPPARSHLSNWAAAPVKSPAFNSRSIVELLNAPVPRLKMKSTSASNSCCVS